MMAHLKFQVSLETHFLWALVVFFAYYKRSKLTKLELRVRYVNLNAPFSRSLGIKRYLIRKQHLELSKGNQLTKQKQKELCVTSVRYLKFSKISDKKGVVKRRVHL